MLGLPISQANFQKMRLHASFESRAAAWERTMEEKEKIRQVLILSLINVKSKRLIYLQQGHLL